MVNISSLPDNWELGKIKDLISKTPLTGIKLKKRDYQDDGNYPVIDQGQDLIGGYTDKEMPVPCEVPVIVFGDHTKAIKYIDFPFVAGADGIKVIKPDAKFEPKFFYYLLQAIQLPDKGYARHYQYLEKEIVPIPPRPTQREIVFKIEELFSQLDAGVAGLKHAQAALQRYRASVLKAAFEGRLVPQDPNDEPITEWLRKSNITFSKTGDQLNLPKGWIKIKLKELTSVGTGATPLRSNKAYWENGTIPWIKSGAINQSYINQAEEFITPKALNETNTKIIQAGSLLIAMYGEGKTRGKISELMIDAATNQACATIQFNDKTILFKPYIKLFFNNFYTEMRKLASGGVQPNLNLTLIKNIKINLPPLPEQVRIVDKLQTAISIIEKMENAIEVCFKFSEALHQSILKEAFDGQLIKDS